MRRTYTIGAAARLTGVASGRLRSWEAAGLIAPRRASSGYRLYGEADLLDIARVRDEVARHGRFGAHVLAATGSAGSASDAVEAPSRSPAAVAATALDSAWAVIVARSAERGVHVAGAWGVGIARRASSLVPDADAWGVALLSTPFVVPDCGLAGQSGAELIGVGLGGDGWRAAVVAPRGGVQPGHRTVALLSALVSLHRDSSVRAVRMRRVEEELNARSRLGRLAAEATELRSLLHGALDVLLELSGLDMGAVLLADRPRRCLLIAATRNVSPRYLDGIRHWRADEGIIGRAHTGMAPVTSRDLRLDPRVTRQAVRDEGMRAFIGVPLLHRGRSLGVIELGSRTPRRFRPDEVAALARCAEQVALGVAALRDEHPVVAEPTSDRVPADASVLTARQAAILQLLAESYATAEISALLGLSPKTIANTLTAAFRALGVANRTQAVSEALRRGLVAVPVAAGPLDGLRAAGR